MAIDGGLWTDIKPWILSLDPVRIEDDLACGVPDVNHRSGWVELKHAKAWPKRATTPLRVPSYKPEQRNWGRKRIAAGGNHKLLIRVANDLLLFHGHDAGNHLGHLPRVDLLELVIGCWPFKGKVWKRELADALEVPPPRQLTMNDIWNI